MLHPSVFLNHGEVSSTVSILTIADVLCPRDSIPFKKLISKPLAAEVYCARSLYHATPSCQKWHHSLVSRLIKISFPMPVKDFS